MTLNAAQKWFRDERGIQPETLERLGVETSDEEARWKVGDRYKIRKGFRSGEERKFFYSETGPFRPWLLPVKDANITDPVICFEGETDAMAVWQAGREKYGMIAAIPGVDAYTDAVAKSINKLSAKAPLYFVLDNDEPGGSNGGPGQVDEAWARIKAKSPRAKRVRLPQEYKDVCAYLQFYGLEDFDKLVQAASVKSYNYDTFNLVTGQDREVDWLWQHALPRSAFGFIQGNGNVGKSWILMGLCVAIAERWPSFMGMPLDIRKGRAMLVDNENPASVVRHRLSALGLQLENQDKIRIYHHRVRLDSHPERLIEDVETFDPDFVGLDSLTSLSSADENSVNQIGVMFDKAVIPLSRDLGVATFLLHHVNRFTQGGAQGRTRGGEHIANHTDIAWDMREDTIGDNNHVKVLSRFRNRYGAIPMRINFLIEDKAHGQIDMRLLDDDRGGVM